MRVPLARATAAAALLLAALGWSGAAVAQGIALPGLSRPGAGAASSASVPWAHSPWVKSHNASARLIAGAAPAAAGRRVLAGLEIRLADGWKTYWRHPGDDGGLPPTFDWTSSRNLKGARVLFPVPERIKSLNGTTLGYGKAVILPIEVEPADPAEPVSLKLALEYGICREICVPAEAQFELIIPATLAAMPPDLAASLALVPRLVEGAAVAAVVKSAKAVLAGPAPALTFDIAATSGATDLFVEAPGGIWLPVPSRVGEPSKGVQRFRIDLKGVEEAGKLAGQQLRLTVAAPDGGVELAWTVR
jgi:DsbC/DsbD-like thiol-disulfide interchange protein